MFRPGENHFLQFRSLENSLQNWLKNGIKKKRKKCCNLPQISLHAGFSWRLRTTFLEFKTHFLSMRGPTYSSRELLVLCLIDLGTHISDIIPKRAPGTIWGWFLEDLGGSPSLILSPWLMFRKLVDQILQWNFQRNLRHLACKTKFTLPYCKIAASEK